MRIEENLFDLTPDQERLSKDIYNGKIVKCLVAPYHTHFDIIKGSNLTDLSGIHIFPERESSYPWRLGFISNIVNHLDSKEIKIITSDLFIIQDMIDSSVRVLKKDGKIVPCPIKTFQANIHSIKYDILDMCSDDINRPFSVIVINNIVDRINKAKPSSITQVEYDDLFWRIDLIGERVLEIKLKSMLSEKKMR